MLDNPLLKGVVSTDAGLGRDKVADVAALVFATVLDAVFTDTRFDAATFAVFAEALVSVLLTI
jgi:hypothetical protein